MESLSFPKGKKICYIFCHFGKDQTIQNFEQEWDTQCFKILQKVSFFRKRVIFVYREN